MVIEQVDQEIPETLGKRMYRYSKSLVQERDKGSRKGLDWRLLRLGWSKLSIRCGICKRIRAERGNAHGLRLPIASVAQDDGQISEAGE